MREAFDLFERLQRSARLMVGVPDYESYVTHRRATHPDEPFMTYEEFFRDCQDRRYGAKGGGMARCC